MLMNLKKEFKEIKAMFSDKKQIALSIEDSIRLKETLHTLLVERFINACTLGASHYLLFTLRRAHFDAL